MPASPFDFEDPERFAPVEFPAEPDIVYTLGVRLQRAHHFAWRCPHNRTWALDPDHAALACLKNCVDEETGYALDDPKHPTFAERYAEQADLDR